MIIQILLFLAYFANSSPQIYINYGVDREGVQLFHFFHDVHDGYYIDIGAYDSIFASNTLNLEAMGWTGLNVDANPFRLARFIYSRPWELSINYAIGDQNKYVTLYELAQDSSSTVSPKVKEYVQNFKPLVQQIQIPSIGMGQLCQRFYKTRPLFINLDIEGYGTQALKTNNWTNQKCRPDIFFSQINQQAIASGLPLPQKVMAEQGYKKWRNTVGLNQIYIHESVFKAYELKYEKGVQLMQGKEVVNIDTVARNLAVKLNLSTILATHYQPSQDSIFYHFTKHNEIIDLDHINRYSNWISNGKNRPIFIMDFNPHSNHILLKHQNYSTELIKVNNTMHNKYYHLKVFNRDGSIYNAYILDHFIKPEIQPKILIAEQVKQPLIYVHNQFNLADMVDRPNSLSINDKVLLMAQKQIEEYNNFVNKTYHDNLLKSKQTILTLTNNHEFTKQQLEIMILRLKQLEALQKELVVDELKKDQQQQQIQYSKRIANVMRLLIVVLFFVFFSFLFINALVCIIYDESNENLNIEQPRKLRHSKNRKIEQVTTENIVNQTEEVHSEEEQQK